jgi:hypothetical protein
MVGEKVDQRTTASLTWNIEENHTSVLSRWTVFGPSVASQRTATRSIWRRIIIMKIVVMFVDGVI